MNWEEFMLLRGILGSSCFPYHFLPSVQRGVLLPSKLHWTELMEKKNRDKCKFSLNTNLKTEVGYHTPLPFLKYFFICHSSKAKGDEGPACCEICIHSSRLLAKNLVIVSTWAFLLRALSRLWGMPEEFYAQEALMPVLFSLNYYLFLIWIFLKSRNCRIL